MRLFEVSRVVLCAVVLFAALYVADSPFVASMEPIGELVFVEMVMITVDCQSASVLTMLNIHSENDTLIRFPSPVDLNDTNLEDAVIVGVMSSADSSLLTYQFEGISETQAETNAAAITPSIMSAVDVSFEHESTDTVGAEVHVNYTGPGQSDMPSFVSSMVSECVGAEVDGFSDAILSLATQTTASALMLSAYKESGGFNWSIGIGAMCSSMIPTGSGPHTINVLTLLGVSSLTPSPLSFSTALGFYQSIVLLTISDTALSFDSCEPDETTDPSQRGWMHMFPTTGLATFYFGNDPSPVAPLTFTFGGIVIPEFTPLATMITLALIAACTITFKRRMLRKNRG